MNTAPIGSDLKALAARYIEAVGQKRFEAVAPLLHPELEFGGNVAASRGADAWLAALRRLSPILLRNDIRRVFADGNEVCVIYDFVTVVCPVPSVEWLVIGDERIRSIFLLFDRSRWPEVLEELRRRTA